MTIQDILDEIARDSQWTEENESVSGNNFRMQRPRVPSQQCRI